MVVLISSELFLISSRLMSFESRSYKEILADEDEIITAQRLIWLLKSVEAKLDNQFERCKKLYTDKWKHLTGLVAEYTNGPSIRSEVIRNTLKDKELHDEKWYTHVKNAIHSPEYNYCLLVKGFETELLDNETEFLYRMVTSPVFIHGCFELLKTADEMHQSIQDQFDILTEKSETFILDIRLKCMDLNTVD